MELEEIRTAMSLIYEVMADPKLAQAIARMYRQIHSALVEEGFSREEALTILKAFQPGKTS